jgi:hypothetical protein
LQQPFERPVFILGSGRCGSTLLQSILNSHHDFLIWGEHGGWLRKIADAYYRAMTDDGAGRLERGPAGSLPDQIARLRTTGYRGCWDNPRTRAELPPLFRSFIHSAFAAAGTGPARWGFKEIRYCIHPNDRTPEFLLECFPQATFLIVVRNPWDTVFSMFSTWWRHLGANIESVDRELGAAWTQWSRQYANLFVFHRTAPQNSAIVRFEDMLDPAYAGTIFAAVGAEPETDIRPVLREPVGACIRDDEFASLVRERMALHSKQLLWISHRTRLLYGYHTPPPS